MLAKNVLVAKTDAISTSVETNKKFRVVFDFAARFKNVNLNDFLLRGSKMTNSLIGVLLRFRLYLHAIVQSLKFSDFRSFLDVTHLHNITKNLPE